MLLMRVAQKHRVIWYRIISNNHARGTPTPHQPIHAVGLGTIVFDGMVVFGVFPSPLFPATKDVLPRAAVAGNPLLVIREIQKIDGAD